METSDRPSLRWPLDIQHAEVSGQKVVVLSDPQGLAQTPACIPLELIAIVSRFDGKRTIDEIVAEGAPYGVTLELVQRIISDLHQLSLLDTPELRLRWEGIKREYGEKTLRVPSLAGRGYPQGEQELRAMIDGFLEQSDGVKAPVIPGKRVLAVLSPHIDYQRGWQTYCSAYTALENVERPDVIFLLGTSHQPGEGFFHLTTKDFETPLGVFPSAKDAVMEISSSYGESRCFRDEILHRDEHSIELQLPFLAHRYAGDEMPELVPILVGSFHPCLVEKRSPGEEPGISEFLVALGECFKERIASGKRVLLYAGVDLAHMGLHFGDTARVSDNGLEDIERSDRELLDSVVIQDEEALFEHIVTDGDRRRICGFPVLYVVLSVLRQSGLNLEGRLLEYRQAVEPASDCVVTCASACWYCSKN